MTATHLTPRIDRVLRWTRGPDVLDVGCVDHSVDTGSPLWLHGVLRRRFPNVVGVDMSEEGIATLSKSGYTNVHVADAQELPLDRSFDTIVAGEVIEHLENPGRFLVAARSHLKPGGRLILTTPNPFSLMHLLYAIKNFPTTCSNPEHTAWFCPSTMQELAHRMGFEIEHWELVEHHDPRLPDLPYRLFVALIRIFGRLFPAILRNNTIFLVLRAKGSLR